MNHWTVKWSMVRWEGDVWSLALLLPVYHSMGLSFEIRLPTTLRVTATRDHAGLEMSLFGTGFSVDRTAPDLEPPAEGQE